MSREQGGFWFSPNTTLLFASKPYTIGKSRPDHLTIGVIPEINEYVEKNVSHKIIWDWFHLKASNIIDKSLEYKPYPDTDMDFEVRVAPSDNSNVYINVDFDYTHRFYKHYYYAPKDLLKNVGALKAIILPFLAYLMPVYALVFFFRLARILQDKDDKDTIDAII